MGGRRRAGAGREGEREKRRVLGIYIIFFFVGGGGLGLIRYPYLSRYLYRTPAAAQNSVRVQKLWRQTTHTQKSAKSRPEKTDPTLGM